MAFTRLDVGIIVPRIAASALLRFPEVVEAFKVSLLLLLLLFL